MQAMQLSRLISLSDEDRPLEPVEIATPLPALNEVLMRITACSVYHAELDEIGRTQPPQLPMIPGHEVIGYIDAVGNSVDISRLRERVGIGIVHAECGVSLAPEN